MTRLDNLRDRIAKALFDESYLDAPLETIPNEIHPGYHELAQAIIDEFELITETHAATHSKRAMTRIISAWEWDNQ